MGSAGPRGCRSVAATVRDAEGLPDCCRHHRFFPDQRPAHPADRSRAVRRRRGDPDDPPGALCRNGPGRRRSPRAARYQRAGCAARHRPGRRCAAEPDRDCQVGRFSAAAGREAEDPERRGYCRRRDRSFKTAGTLPQPHRYLAPRPDLRHRPDGRVKQPAKGRVIRQRGRRSIRG